MICWVCDEFEAHGICATCGRAVCRYCAQTRLHPVAIYSGKDNVFLLGSRDALWCGLCEIDNPIDAPELMIGEVDE